jgi:DNA-binding response OmpR family regulator
MKNHPKRILVVDDDSSLRSLLTLVIEEEGYEVIEARNGEDCLIQFTRKPPDLVLLDAVMPDMDGFECCEKLRSLNPAKELPILMITFLDDQESIEKAFAVSATDYLTKPIHWAVLLQRLKRLITSSEAMQQLDSLRQWQSTLNDLLAFLPASSLAPEQIGDICAKISDYFQAQAIFSLLKDTENLSQSPIKYAEVNLDNAPTIVNTIQELDNHSELNNFLSRVNAQSCLIFKPWIITDSNPRQWTEVEINNFRQASQILSHLKMNVFPE